MYNKIVGYFEHLFFLLAITVGTMLSLTLLSIDYGQDSLTPPPTSVLVPDIPGPFRSSISLFLSL